MVNTETFTLSIPPEKLKKIFSTYLLLRDKTHCSKKQLQSLLGSLLYVSKCVQTSRFFLNRLVDVLRSMEDRIQVPLTIEAKRDVNWFVKFLPNFNTVTISHQIIQLNSMLAFKA